MARGERDVRVVEAQLEKVIAEDIAAGEMITRKLTARDATTGKFTTKKTKMKMKEARPA